jgi:rRNA-processing protein FCF1
VESNTIGKPSDLYSSGPEDGLGDGPPAVLLDANALFLPFTHGLDLEKEVARWSGHAPVWVPVPVLGELRRLKDRDVPNARAALMLAGRFPSLPAPGLGDPALLAVAVKTGAWVVTADQALRARLVKAGVSVLYPRDRSRLDLERGDPVAASGSPARRTDSGNR